MTSVSKPKLYLSHAVLILASFLSVFPLYYMICGATNPSIDVVRGKLIPGTYPVSYTHLVTSDGKCAKPFGTDKLFSGRDSGYRRI